MADAQSHLRAHAGSAAASRRCAGQKTAYRYSAQLGPVPQLVKLDLSNAKGTLKLQVSALADTGLPLAGVGAATEHELPVFIEVRTAGHTEHLRTAVVLRRDDGAGLDWRAP